MNDDFFCEDPSEDEIEMAEYQLLLQTQWYQVLEQEQES